MGSSILLFTSSSYGRNDLTDGGGTYRTGLLPWVRASKRISGKGTVRLTMIVINLTVPPKAPTTTSPTRTPSSVGRRCHPQRSVVPALLQALRDSVPVLDLALVTSTSGNGSSNRHNCVGRAPSTLPTPGSPTVLLRTRLQKFYLHKHSI